MEPTLTRFARFVLPVVIALPVVACGASGPPASPSPTPPSIVCADAAAHVKNPGVLTFSTTDPAYEPWFEDDPAIQYGDEPSNAPQWHVTDPYSLHGFEDGVAYSLANLMGFEADHVRWVPNTREDAVKPGAKNFDIFVGQMAAPPTGSAAVDFSDTYLDAIQALVAQSTSSITGAKSVGDLQDFNLGAVAGTSSETLIRQLIKPRSRPQVYLDEVVAAAAVRRGDIDGFVADIATAFFQINGPGSGDPAPIRDGVVVGKFDASKWVDHYAFVLEKGNPLLACVNSALAEIKRDGSLEEFRQEDIPVGEDTPTFQ